MVLVIVMVSLALLAMELIEPMGAVLQSTAPVTSLIPTSKKLVAPWLLASQFTLMGTTTTSLAVKTGSP